MSSGKYLLGCDWAAGLLAACLAACAGCGTGRATVEGTVTLDGQPIESGSIVFEPADGAGPTAGGQIENGKYRLAEEGWVMPGKKIVRIIAIRATGRKLDASMPGAEGEGGPSAPAQLVDELACYIPAIYNEKSTLTCEVVAGKANQHNFELKSE